MHQETFRGSSIPIRSGLDVPSLQLRHILGRQLLPPKYSSTQTNTHGCWLCLWEGFLFSCLSKTSPLAWGPAWRGAGQRGELCAAISTMICVSLVAAPQSCPTQSPNPACEVPSALCDVQL